MGSVQARGQTKLQPFMVAFGLMFAGIATVAVVAIMLDGQAPLAVLLVPGSFIVIGLSLAFFRRGFVVDMGTRTVTTWWGVGLSMVRKQRPLAEARMVTLKKETRGAGKNKKTVFATRVETVAAEDIELFAPTDYRTARAAAEATANALGVGMADSGHDVTVTRAAGTLDEPLRDRLVREHGSAPSPNEAPPGRLSVARDGEETVCTLPRAGFDMDLLSRLVVMFGGGAWLTAVLLHTGLGVAERAVAAGAMVLLAAWLVVPRVARRLMPTRVRYSAKGIAVQSALGRAQRIDVEDLEELFAVPTTTMAIFTVGGGLVARSDARVVEIGGGLTPQEQSWLYTSICYTLVTTAWGYRG